MGAKTLIQGHQENSSWILKALPPEGPCMVKSPETVDGLFLL